jgi:Patatin-like phospholipase
VPDAGATPPARDGSKKLTHEQRERRREKTSPVFEKLQKEPVLVGVVALILYLVLGDVWSAIREGSTFLGAVKAFFKSYFGLVLSAGLVLAIWGLAEEGVKEAIKAWGGYVLALVLGPLALWYWAGSYNFWRDLLIIVFVIVVLFHRGRPFRLLILRSLVKMERWARDPKPPRWRWLARLIERLREGPTTPRSPDQQGNAEKPVIADGIARLRRFLTRQRMRHVPVVLTGLIAACVLTSLADRWFGPQWTSVESLPASPTRFREIADKHAQTWARAEPLRLGVALSGGGFRAALLHAGVLAALDERGFPIASIATVSGGSIIGGFYVVGGSPTDFRDAVAGGRFNLKRELIDFPNLIHLACPGHIPILDINLFWPCSFSRVDVQANLLDRVLFNGKSVSQLRADRKSDPADSAWWKYPPWWVMGATDLRHGQGVGLSADGIFRRAHATPWRGLQKPDQQKADLLRVPSEAAFEDLAAHETFGTRRIAELVAVSGAFPGAFGSTILSIGKDNILQIVDGGITDNLGYSLLMSALEKAPNSPREKLWALNMVLISDGGMPLSPKEEVAGYSEFFRAMDVVYASSGIMVKPNSLDKVWLSPRTIVPEKLTEADLARLPAALNKSRTLKQFQDDFRRAQAIFLDTSTLKDRFGGGWVERLDRHFWHKDKLPGDKEAVDALFTLGQYLVYLNLPDICEGLRLPEERCKP